MRGPSTGTRHSCKNHDCDKYATKDEEQANVVECRKGTIGKEHNAAAAPCDDKIANEDVPRLGGLFSDKIEYMIVHSYLGLKFGMISGIHLNRLVSLTDLASP